MASATYSSIWDCLTYECYGEQAKMGEYGVLAEYLRTDSGGLQEETTALGIPSLYEFTVYPGAIEGKCIPVLE